jgi:RNA polymerase sigma-70 factor (ECF subfamily)
VAEDLTQEVFLRLCRMRGLRNPAALTTWLYTVSRNVALDHLRRRRLEQRMLPALPEDPPTPLDVAQDRELFHLVRGAIDRLGEPRRSIFLMSVIEEMDYASIGAATGCPEATVNSRVFRSWRRVRSSMRRYQRA